MSLTLYGRDNDYRTQKILVAADHAGIRIQLNVTASSDEIEALCHGAVPPVLETRRGCLFQSNAILRHIAEMAPDSGLYGPREFDCAQIDQWLDFSRNDLEVPLALLVASAKKTATVDQNTLAAAREDVARVCAALDTTLASRTFLVGQKFTIADIAICAALHDYFALVMDVAARSAAPALARYYMTVSHQPAFLAVMGEAGLFGGGPLIDSARVAAAPVAATVPTVVAPAVVKGGKTDSKQAAAPAAAAPAQAPAAGKGKAAASGGSGGTEAVGVEHTPRASFTRPAAALAREAAAAAAAGAGPVAAVAEAGPVTTVGAHGGLSSSCRAPPANFTLFRRGRTRVNEIVNGRDGGRGLIGSTLVVKGWAKTVRTQGGGRFAFVELNDGSCFGSLQVVVAQESTEGFAGVVAAGGTGASFSFTGVLVASPAAGQAVELQATAATVLGGTDPAHYPLAKKRHSVEHLREVAHLRVRTNIGAAVMRMRNAMAFATNKFFNDNGFLLVHTPLITASDCEGAGEMFAVSTLLPKDNKVSSIPTKKDGTIDFSQDFFSRPAFLTVSGQLNVETHCLGLSDVYTFGPTFRAENSHTTRHLAEFWMIEPEIAFGTLEDDKNLAEDYLKFCVNYALSHCAEDLAFFDKNVEPGLIERLRNVVAAPFGRITYTQAVELLTMPEHLAAGNFEVTPEWGMDLGSEHERYITEKVFRKPVIVSNYPKAIKAFYMRADEGGRTVAAMDILVPKIGEIIGGSQREERLEVLEERIREMGHNPEDYWWYLDLRRYGSVPHAGFGLGFERLVLFVTGVENIRDVIPFPRVPGRAEF